ncbi:MAG: hypothetical protein E6G35_14360 [Actinobacteria bacterium]|nr:MAG: hypothetical protein E6G35_14360 [Actinomycetota bacterium]
MKRSTRLGLSSLAVAGLVAGAVLGIAQLASAATNLVTNPGFESGLTGWSCSAGKTVSAPVHSGAAALEGAASNSDTAQCTQDVAVVSGQQYTLSAWVQGNYVYLGVTGGASTWTPGSSGYSQLSLTFTASSSTAQLYLHGWYAQGSYHADDVVLAGPGGTVNPPPTPTGLHVTGTTSTSVSLAWTASTGATGYRVYRGTSVTTVTGTSATITGLNPGTTYSFAVSATNSGGESAKSGTVSATTGAGTGNPPPTPTGLHVTGTTSTSVSLAWTASTGATGYKVYRGTSVTTATGTSATIGGLAAGTTYSFAVSATNANGESAKSAAVSATTASGGGGGGSPRSWPYIDITMSTPAMADVARATGQKFFTLAFVLGGSGGCVPTWGGTIDLTDARISKQISDLRALGGDVAVSFGGAQGPYLQQTCPSRSAQVGAIEKVIDTFHVKRIDFDIEASVPIDTMNKAIAQVQRERAGTVVSYTLEVQSEDFGLTPSLGTDVLNNARSNGVDVGIVNPMTMDFGSSHEWGDAVINAAQATLNQMAQIWPEKSSATLHRMLGVTPMIGRNDTGPIFSLADGQKLVNWANTNHIGSLGFWSVGRDITG